MSYYIEIIRDRLIKNYRSMCTVYFQKNLMKLEKLILFTDNKQRTQL